jgi:hypothetical protein
VRSMLRRETSLFYRLNYRDRRTGLMKLSKPVKLLSIRFWSIENSSRLSKVKFIRRKRP